jgi:type I restriction enzyme S subunit
VKHGFAFSGAGFHEELTGCPIVVNIGNFDYSGGFRFESTKTREFRGEYPREFELCPGDLLVVMTCQTPGGEILGLPGFVPSDGRQYLHNQRLGLVQTSSERLDHRYAYYVFRSPSVTRQLISTATGTKILHTSPQRIEEVEIDLPPPSMQRAIAEVLGALDDKIELNRRIIGLGTEAMAAIYRQSVEHSPRLPATTFINPILGGTPTRSEDSYWGGTVPWATAKDVAAAERGILTTTAESITELGLSRSPAKLAPRGTTLITARGTVGRIARTAGVMAFNQTCYALAPRNGLPPLFAYCAVQEEIESLTALTHGTIFDTITKRTFDLLLLRVPPEAHWEVLNARLSALDDLMGSLLRESRSLTVARDVLLPKLLSGEVRVRDAGSLAGEAV